MGMSFEYIREIQRKEKNSSQLSEVEQSFYKDLAAYIHQTEESCKASGNGFRELENTAKLAREVFEKREQKLVMKALRSVRTKEYDEERMTPEERVLFKALVEAIRSNRTAFDGVMLGDYKFSTPKDTLIKENGNKVVLARVRREIPVFVGSDTKEYGPYKAGDVIKLPRAEADLLSKQGLVEVM